MALILEWYMSHFINMTKKVISGEKNSIGMKNLNILKSIVISIGRLVL
ncbi:MAG: hypothetical protein ACI9N1_001542 [Flavobacteriales bacterium]|jgi:hypothetical protein